MLLHFQTQVSPSNGGGMAGAAPDGTSEVKKEKRSDTPDFMAELNNDSSDETAADLANLERFISEDTSDGIINADTFKDLISEIHDLPPEFMEEFDFETDKSDFGPQTNGVMTGAGSEAESRSAVDPIISRRKQEEVEAADREIQAAMLDIGKSMSMNSSNNGNNASVISVSASSCNSTNMSHSGNPGSSVTQMTSCSTYSNQTTISGGAGTMYDVGSKMSAPPMAANNPAAGNNAAMNRMPFGSGGTEMSPAALTLKQMAEQHQHKTQMGMGPMGMTPPTMAPGPTGPAGMGGVATPMTGPGAAMNTPNPNAMRMPMRNYPADYPVAGNFMPRPPYQGYGPVRPNMQQQQQQQQQPNANQQQQPQQSMAGSNPGLVPGAKSSPVPMSQSSPMNSNMGPPTPQQIQQQQQQQQQFNSRKVPTPTNSGRTPPPSTNVQFNQTQQQQMQMNINNNGQQIQVQLIRLVTVSFRQISKKKKERFSQPAEYIPPADHFLIRTPGAIIDHWPIIFHLKTTL